MTLLFDFDGTLVDSMPTYMGIMLSILDDHGIAYEEEDMVRTITPLGFRGTAEYYVQLGVPMTCEAMMQRMRERMIDAYTHRIEAKPHVVDALRTMRAHGVSLNVLTASPHCTLDPCLKRLGVFEWFDHVWSCDDFATTKANPEIYRMAAQRLGTEVEDVLFLDDNLRADQAAKAAGMRVYGVYDPSSADSVEEMKQTLDGFVMDFRKLVTDLGL